MSKYERIHHTGDNEYGEEDDEDEVSSQHSAPARSLQLSGTQQLQPQQLQERKTQRLKRRGSQGSYRSVGSHGFDEDDLGVVDGSLDANNKNNLENDNNNNDATGEGLMSPFRGSFDQEGNAIAYPTTSNIYSSSFDLDDDDDEDDTDVKRYNIHFSPNSADDRDNNSGGGASATHGDAPGGGLPGIVHSFSFPAYLWFSFQSLRQQARQRRAQRLLQQSERDCRQTLWICTMTYCDATDRGIILVSLLILVWSLLIWKVDSKALRAWVGLAGIGLFLLRVSARPTWDYYQTKRSNKRRSEQMEQSLRNGDNNADHHKSLGRYHDRPAGIFGVNHDGDHVEMTNATRRSNNQSNSSSNNNHSAQRAAAASAIALPNPKKPAVDPVIHIV
jgi:hypothetical protein